MFHPFNINYRGWKELSKFTYEKRQANPSTKLNLGEEGRRNISKSQHEKHRASFHTWWDMIAHFMSSNLDNILSHSLSGSQKQGHAACFWMELLYCEIGRSRFVTRTSALIRLRLQPEWAKAIVKWNVYREMSSLRYRELIIFILPLFSGFIFLFGVATWISRAVRFRRILDISIFLTTW